MKKSIKWKITKFFIFVIICCISSIIIFNTLFLEKIYIKEKTYIIKKSYEILNKGIIEAYKNGYSLSKLFKNTKNSDRNYGDSNLTYLIRELHENYNLTIVLMDKNNKTYSIYENNNRFDRRMMAYLFKEEYVNDELQFIEKNEKYKIVIHTPRQNFMQRPQTSDSGPTEFYESEGPGEKQTNNIVRRFFIPQDRNADIECFGMFADDETAFFMTIPVGSLKEPIDLFNRVMIFLSISLIIIGSIAIYLISNNLTKPLVYLTNLSKKMSNLEFENKYIDDCDDEIGELGNAMNEMSSKLEKALIDLKNANVKLKADLVKKEQLDAMRQEFVANVSHELKTPIALIEGYAEGLEDTNITGNPENREYYIDVIKDEAKKMNTLVYQLLDLSQMERRMSEIEIAHINLYEIVSGVIKSLQLKFNDINITPQNHIDKNTYVWADAYKTEQVMKNYLTNAIHYVDVKKVIKIYTEKLDDDKIRFCVFNSGMQLSDDDLDRVWEKFYKVDKARTREYGGTGLGLSIVKAIANQHNTICGCKNIENNGEKGIVFYFDFNIK